MRPLAARRRRLTLLVVGAFLGQGTAMPTRTLLPLLAPAGRAPCRGGSPSAAVGGPAGPGAPQAAVNGAKAEGNARSPPPPIPVVVDSSQCTVSG